MDITSKFCHHCGTKLPATSKFCSGCGTSLASIDEKPPGSIPKPPLGRIQQQNTFEPTIVGASRRRDDDDYEGSIHADRVESLAELGISMSELDISIDMPRNQRETFSDVVKGGLGLPPGYKEPPRPAGALEGGAVEILREGAAIK